MLQIGKAIYTAVEDTEICAREEHISFFFRSALCPWDPTRAFRPG